MSGATPETYEQTRRYLETGRRKCVRSMPWFGVPDLWRSNKTCPIRIREATRQRPLVDRITLLSQMRSETYTGPTGHTERQELSDRRTKPMNDPKTSRTKVKRQRRFAEVTGWDALVVKWKRRSKQLWKHSLTLSDGPALYTRICSKEALRYAQELRAYMRKHPNAEVSGGQIEKGNSNE